MELQTALYMIPVNISDSSLTDVMPPLNGEIISAIKYFIVENIRTARRFLKKVDRDLDLSDITFFELNRHTPDDEISGYLNPLRDKMPVGVMSEAGCPGVADPGASVVRIAQAEGFKVIPLIGPSSILLALMASGLNGQRFAFHGYLPVKDNERDKSIKDLETRSRREDTTQIFIETPYRNNKIFESLLKILSPETLLCVATDITGPDESVITRKVIEWRRKSVEIKKAPSIFLFYSQGLDPNSVHGKKKNNI